MSEYISRTESIRKLSNFNFQQAKTLHLNILKRNLLHFSRAVDVISYL